MATGLLLCVHAAATWAMVGLIWFVQVVHYALFPHVGRDGFARYEAAHSRRTTLVVGPLMGVEAATAIGLCALRGDTLAWTGAALLAAIWASTAWIQVPCHARLGRGYDAATARRLVATNWIRTWAWSARGLVAGAMLLGSLPARVA